MCRLAAECEEAPREYGEYGSGPRAGGRGVVQRGGRPGEGREREVPRRHRLGEGAGGAGVPGAAQRLRRFIFPVAALFLAWYLLYVLLASYAPEFMAVKVVGNINIGLLFGLLQFVSTFAITMWYVRFADKRVDPLSGAIRDELGGNA